MHAPQFAGFADRLFELVIEIDPARTSWDKLRGRADQRARELREELDHLVKELKAQAHARYEKARAEHGGVAIAETKLQELLESARNNLNQLAEATQQVKESQRWRTIYASLAQNYEALTRELEALDVSGRWKKLTPTNWARSIFHALGGLTGALCYHFLLTKMGATIVMASLVTVFTTLEILRRRSADVNETLMKLPFFRRVARAREYYRVNSATYYAYGMLLITLVCPQPAVEAACLVLAFGDPAASNVGRRFGKIKLHKTKSLAGTIAFVAAAFLVVFAFTLALYPGQSIGLAAKIAAIGAFTGALVELYSEQLDDNLTVPVAVAAAVTFFAL